MVENELLLNRQLREDLINEERLEVLEKVKELVLLQKGNCLITEQVADYYEVSKNTIDSVVDRNNDELISDGYKILKGTDLKEFKGYFH